MTGFTGIILTFIWIIMYAFALPITRRKIYNWFWYTHSLYPLFFIFLVLHGSGRLIQVNNKISYLYFLQLKIFQAPFLYYFLLGPIILFTIDWLISISRKKVEIPVIRAGILPSSKFTYIFYN